MNKSKKVFCCEMMDEQINGEDTIIVYYPKFRECGIPVQDGGSSYIVIQFRPWCGNKLPASLRDEWFTILDKQGIDYDDDCAISEEMKTDMWWKNRKL